MNVFVTCVTRERILKNFGLEVRRHVPDKHRQKAKQQAKNLCFRGPKLKMVSGGTKSKFYMKLLGHRRQSSAKTRKSIFLANVIRNVCD